MLEIVRAHGPSDQPVKILDVGTGTGCLLITLLAELPAATGVGTDISADALRTAASNAVRCGVSDRATWRQGRSLESINETFDLLVSNPPYIPSGEISTLEAEVRLFDPEVALDGGPDGMDIYREIARDAPGVVPDGHIVLEVGLGQHINVGEILKKSFLAAIALETKYYMDLAGHVRCVAMRTR